MHTTWTRRDPVSPLSQSGEARRCNNAGYGLVGVLEELSDEQIARNFDANFSARCKSCVRRCRSWARSAADTS